MSKKSDITARDYDVLATLKWVNHGSSNPRAWARPLDVGGGNGSHHSATLAKLEAHGLVQSKQRGWPDPVPGAPEPKWKPGAWNRGAKVYRITAKGREALKP